MNKHTFPTGYKITTTEPHTDADANELMHLAIDREMQIDGEMITERIVPSHPYLTVKDNTLMLSNVKQDNTESYRMFVTLAVFKALMKGQTTLPIPFKSTLQLSEKYTALITKKGVEVGCQFFPHEILDELHKQSVEARQSQN